MRGEPLLAIHAPPKTDRTRENWIGPAICRICLRMPSTATTARLEARLPPETHALLKRAAEIQGRSLTDFVVTAAQEAATRVVDTAGVVRLAVADQERFADALLNPRPVAPAMERARERHRALIE